MLWACLQVTGGEHVVTPDLQLPVPWVLPVRFTDGLGATRMWPGRHGEVMQRWTERSQRDGYSGHREVT